MSVELWLHQIISKLCATALNSVHLSQTWLGNVAFGCWVLTRNLMSLNMQRFCYHTLLVRNVQQHLVKTSTKRSHCCKHRFSVEHIVVAASLWFTASVLSSVLFHKGFQKSFHIWIKPPFYHYDYGVRSWPMVHILLFYYLRCVVR